MDVPFVFGGDASAEEQGCQAVQDEEKHPSAVQRGDGQEVHHPQVDGQERGEIEQVIHRLTYAAGGLRHLPHGVHNADGAGEGTEAHRAGEQVLQAPPDHPHEVHAVGQTQPQLAAEGGLLALEVQAVHGDLLALHLVLPGRQGQVVQYDLFSISAHHDVVGLAVAPVQEGGDVAVEQDGAAVDGDDLVTGLEHGLPLAGEAVHEAAEGGGDVAGGGSEEGEDEEHPGQEVGGGTGDQNQEFFPPGGVAEGPWVVALPVLPFHGAEPADGEQAEGVFGLLPLPVPQLRPHADGELQHLHAGGFGHQEVTQLVDGNEEAEDDDGDDDIDEFGHDTSHSFTYGSKRTPPLPGRRGRRSKSVPGYPPGLPARFPGRTAPNPQYPGSQSYPARTAPPPPHWRR